MTTRRLPREQRRLALLDVARDVVAAEGFSALTIDRVARAAQVTRTVVYQQFTDLAGLMTALLDRESAIAFAGMSTVEWASPEQVGGGILAYLQAAPASWRIILRPSDGAPAQLRTRLDIGRAYARKIAAQHLSGTAGAAVDPDSATVRILLVAIEELARLHLDDPRRYPDDAVLAHLESLIGWAVRCESARAG